MTWGQSIGIFFAGFAASYIMTKWVTARLRARAILDQPNQRSSHSVPTPRGGGIAVLTVVVISFLGLGLTGYVNLKNTLPVVALACGLAAVCWRDDLRGLGAGIRIIAHMVCVGLALALGLVENPLLHGTLPPAAGWTVTALLWIWFINLFNFMDGIDGLAAVETIAIAIGLAVIAAGTDLALGSVVLAGAMAGFLMLNWHPARVFLGDVGSVPVGFLLGWMLLSLAAEGAWAAAVILPAYFLTDATVTLLRRLARGEKVWQAHREHFYQYAVRNGNSHARVSAAVGIANFVLIGLAIFSYPDNAVWCVIAAYGVVAFLVFWLVRTSGPGFSRGEID